MVDFALLSRKAAATRFYDATVARLGFDNYPFQAEGVARLAEEVTFYLADEMGMGKSPQAIVAADFLDIPHIEVICPAIATEDWRRKFETWSEAGRYVYVSRSNEPIAPKIVCERSVIIWSYEAAIAHRKLIQRNPHRGLLIIDEGHYIKNPETKRARGIYGANCSMVDSESIATHFGRVWVLSGTPVPNGDPREIWSHLRALRPFSILDPATGQPMSPGAWTENFCVLQPGLGIGKVVAIRNEERFLRILRPFLLRRTGEVAGLPDVRFNLYPVMPDKIPAELAVEAWPELADRLYAILAQAGEGDLDTQLEEQLATVRRLTGLLKIEATVNLVTEELRSGQLDRVVVFGYHVDVVNQIVKGLKPFGAAAITGATSEKNRWAAIDAFNSGKHRVLGSNILAGGTNLSLGGCRHVLFPEVDWVPANNAQAAFRCRRIDGHRDPVLARIITIPGTIDSLQMQVIERKLRHSRLLLPT